MQAAVEFDSSLLWLLTPRTVRASLFASAVATSIRGLRASILARDDPDGGPFRMAQQMTAIAPVISNRLISRCPIFEVLPRICHPPVDFCLGTSPHQAANSRPLENSSIGGAKA